MEDITLRTQNEQQTISAGETFAAQLNSGDVVALVGDLGAGKTEFIKGICKHFAVEELVTSPTFTIINQYNGTTPDGDDVVIYHVDLYRIETLDELTQIGFDDMVFSHGAIKLIEWSDKAADLLPEHHWRVQILVPDDMLDLREIHIQQLTKTV